MRRGSGAGSGRRRGCRGRGICRRKLGLRVSIVHVVFKEDWERSEESKGRGRSGSWEELLLGTSEKKIRKRRHVVIEVTYLLRTVIDTTANHSVHSAAAVVVAGALLRRH
jgi:hypothetical protein